MRSLLLLLPLLLFVSCKSTSLTPINTGSNPEWQGNPSSEVLVACLIYTPETRAAFERQMVEALNKEGVRAVASYTLLPSPSALNKEFFLEFLATNENLAVLFSQATTFRKNESSTNTDQNSLVDSLLGGGDWDISFEVTMQNALFVHGRSEAVWWNRVKLEAAAKDVEKIAAKYVHNEISAMKAGDAIKRLK